MAAMAAEVVSVMGRRAVIVLDAYFSVGPVFSVLEAVVDTRGRRLIHIVTRAKRNVVAYGDPPPKNGETRKAANLRYESTSHGFV